jgi:hypothetical protein
MCGRRWTETLEPFFTLKSFKLPNIKILNRPNFFTLITELFILKGLKNLMIFCLIFFALDCPTATRWNTDEVNQELNQIKDLLENKYNLLWKFDFLLDQKLFVVFFNTLDELKRLKKRFFQKKNIIMDGFEIGEIPRSMADFDHIPASHLFDLNLSNIFSRPLLERYPLFFKPKLNKSFLIKRYLLKKTHADSSIQKLLNHPLAIVKRSEDDRVPVKLKGNIFTLKLMDPQAKENLRNYHLLMKILKTQYRSKIDSVWDLQVKNYPICEILRKMRSKIYPVADICHFNSLSEQKDYLKHLWFIRWPPLRKYFNIYQNKTVEVKRFYHWGSASPIQKKFKEDLGKTSTLKAINTLFQLLKFENNYGTGFYVASEPYSSIHYALWKKTPGLYLVDLDLDKMPSKILNIMMSSQSSLNINHIHFFNFSIPIEKTTNHKLYKVKQVPYHDTWFVIQGLGPNYSIKLFKNQKDLFPLELEKIRSQLELLEIPLPRWIQEAILKQN